MGESLVPSMFHRFVQRRVVANCKVDHHNNRCIHSDCKEVVLHSTAFHSPANIPGSIVSTQSFRSWRLSRREVAQHDALLLMIQTKMVCRTTGAVPIALLFVLCGTCHGFTTTSRIWTPPAAGAASATGSRSSSSNAPHSRRGGYAALAMADGGGGDTGSSAGGWRRTTTSADEDNLFVDVSSNDPFVVLGMSSPTTDPKAIKRAYKRRALRFHPDVVTTQQSTAEEKRAASDRFAKINWAYETLSGKRGAGDRTYSGTSSTTSGGGSSAGTGGWTPPHRRSGGGASSASSSTASPSSSSSSSSSADWRDFMPNYNPDDDGGGDRYDAGGDTFEKIFSDLFAGAAVGAAGVAGTGAGLFLDFIEFLEGSVDGYGSAGRTGYGSRSSDDYDAELLVLLRTGSIEDVADEMDDTSLVVEQLQAKAQSIDDDILTVTAEAKMASRYRERIELEERASELSARKEVVDGYLKKARRRLLSLQTRYKEMITYDGANDSYAGGGGSGNRYPSAGSERPSSASSRPPSTAAPASSSSSTTSSRQGSASSGGDEEGAWMHEGFGSSSGRGSRGSGRRRARNSSAGSGATSAGPGSSGSTYADAAPASSPPPPPRRDSSDSTSPATTYLSSSNPNSNVPPHRRTSSYVSPQEEDKRRMRELKVDEEFDKLKRELGL